MENSVLFEHYVIEEDVRNVIYECITMHMLIWIRYCLYMYTTLE